MTLSIYLGGNWEPQMLFPDRQSKEEEDDLVTCKEIRQSLFCILRCNDLKATPDHELDVSENVLASMQLGFSSVTWDMVANELNKDKGYAELARWIDSGCQDTPMPHLKQYLRVKKNLRNADGVPMNGDRVIIPT